ncbi:hypothetical protein NECAME_17395 [Necator americanus]|uniref:Uncharacterized protein n=1 Tax=Necator americanus TaxID=51031 RepID=W2TPF0_NECAM|nr:hypothetical protein NECAME_17395 [Necator americanus]ETN83653.1 hypothetical protein NECAME_17395 [Necator americanus]
MAIRLRVCRLEDFCCLLVLHYLNWRQYHHKHSAPSAKASELSFGDFDYMANGPHKKKCKTRS